MTKVTGEQARAALAALPEGRRHAELSGLVIGQTAELLGRPPHEVDPDVAFQDYGYNSLAALELTSRLSAGTGLDLALTMLFDHPTPRSVADHLNSLFEPRPEAPAQWEPTRPADADDPVVIVGMACRYPGGVRGPDDLWDLVRDGRDAITEFPTDRGWDLDGLHHGDPERPGTCQTRFGGFLDDPGHFDAEFFGIGPRAATAMDPQHRLLLEVGWEAVENAGIDPTSLHGTPTAVYIGLSTHDYATLVASDPGELEGHWGIGNAGSVASGRIAYTLGLRGPALTVDTACSSSLVAMHLAVRALRSGECGTALVGGAVVLATPSLFVEFSRQRGLAPDGRCKSFAEGADGTGWAEGVGMLVLRRRSDAIAAGQPILAVVRGTAINQDGASNGLTAPSGAAQEAVIRSALADAGLRPGDVDAVEAHGTGTALGDPIEARALLAAYGADRTADRPLWIGSLKSNIGHAQAAAGVGGVIKMAFALRHGVLPRTLHASAPTTAVDWSSGALRLLTEEVEVDTGGEPLRVAVSAFGISGTNAHVILEQAERTAAPGRADEEGPFPWLLSARSPEALSGQAARLADHLARHPGATEAGIASALAKRTRFGYRAAVLGADRTEQLARLAAPGVPPVVKSGPRGDIAVMFSGQGSQRGGMGTGLAARYPLFAEELDRVCAAFDPHLDRPLRETMAVAGPDPAADPVHRTDTTQPALFAFEVALFALAKSFGITPTHLIGHSLGELTAAHVAGMLSLPDAATLVAARARLMAALPDGGAMLAVATTEDQVRADIADTALVSVAAVNGPRAVVVSGAEAAVAALAETWRERGLKVSPLRVSHAFHSPLIDPMLAEFGRIARTVRISPPSITVVSNTDGLPLELTAATAPDHWVRHARSTVRFDRGIRHLEDVGVRTFVEIGPDATLATLAQGCVRQPDALVTPLQRRRLPENASLVDGLAELWVKGVDVDFEQAVGQAPPEPLPTYAFQRRHYWVGHQTRKATPEVVPEPTREPRHGSTLELVRGAVAAVLGREPGDPVDPDADLASLGVDSMSGIQLRKELMAITGVEFPLARMIDSPTARSLADLIDSLRPDTGNPAVGDNAEAATLTRLTIDAARRGALLDAVAVVRSAARLLPTTASTSEMDDPPRGLLVADGPARPQLIGVPSFLAGSGPHQFTALAAGFARRPRMAAVALPGFTGSPLPASWADVVDAVARTTRELAGDHPVVLIGHSVGGVLAHATAAALGERVAGLVLIDTFEPGRDEEAQLSAALNEVLDRDSGVVTDANLLAMGHYIDLFAQWRPADIAAPTLLVAADTATASGRLGGQPLWQQVADTVVTVPGNHFTVLEVEATATASAVEAWIGAVTAPSIAG
ncbi:acyl transferase domain-containing protein [Saccharothrix ecbatanensis]|uniref:Acyl transferase domain-containing protein n=1 Tax=Saccharothrix ecbatanensis TaxID=1105145 RepID=A0A7W9HJC5_9PSEU|nr:type I polyketide synthase [Saccharothrix ecbatanensis]MBB5803003.1 acyl transferase domain-containing protein [Saccharothrix ecbatanensis]